MLAVTSFPVLLFGGKKSLFINMILICGQDRIYYVCQVGSELLHNDGISL